MKARLLFTAILAAGICLEAAATVKPRKGVRRHARPVAEQADGWTANGTRPLALGELTDAPLVSTGSPCVPVILVQFNDLKFTSGLPAGTQCETAEQVAAVQAFYDKYCNGDGFSATSYYKEGGSYGAIREYFRDQSNGKFTPEFVVIGPVTLDNGYAYYGKNSSTGSDMRSQQFYADAIKKAQERYSAWAKFDNDGNGTVDMAFFVYAGPGENSFEENEGDDYLWPSESPSGGTINGVKYGCYAKCNETFEDAVDGIGVFVHELSHAMGLPDLYDYNYEQYGLDYWDVMDSGNYCDDGRTPCNYGAYERDFMGWQPLVELDGKTPCHLKLTPVSQNGQGYKIVNPENADEYYIVENRQPENWDLFIGSGTKRTKFHGMLVTHVDYRKARWNSNRVNTLSGSEHQCLTLIPADGAVYPRFAAQSAADYNAYMTSQGGDPFPGTQGVTSLEGARATVYTSTGATPGLMNQPLRNIVENEDGTIELDYCPGGVAPVPAAIDHLPGDEARVPVLSVSGVRVGTATVDAERAVTLPALPPGIYFAGGKKFLIR